MNSRTTRKKKNHPTSHWKHLQGGLGLYYRFLPGGEVFLYGKLSDLMKATELYQILTKNLALEDEFCRQKERLKKNESAPYQSEEQLTLIFPPEEERLLSRLEMIKCIGQRGDHLRTRPKENHCASEIIKRMIS